MYRVYLLGDAGSCQVDNLGIITVAQMDYLPDAEMKSERFVYSVREAEKGTV